MHSQVPPIKRICENGIHQPYWATGHTEAHATSFKDYWSETAFIIKMLLPGAHGFIITARLCVRQFPCLFHSNPSYRFILRSKESTSGIFQVNDMSSRLAKVLSRPPYFAMAGFLGRIRAMEETETQSDFSIHLRRRRNKLHV